MADEPIDISAMFRAKQSEMVALLLGGRGVIKHPTQKGDASERNWLRLLEGYLPSRYKVSSGSVVDADGQVSDQIDILLLDNQYSPVLFDMEGVRYFPAESVYAVFEVKQDVSKEFVEYAGGKVESVRKLRRTSAPIPHAGGVYAPREPVTIIGGLLTTGSVWNPPLGESFAAEVKSLAGEQRLDIGCAMEHGAFTLEGEGPQAVLTQTSSELSLVFLIFRLLEMLQAKGTVPAISYSEWLRHIQ